MKILIMLKNCTSFVVESIVRVSSQKRLLFYRDHIGAVEEGSIEFSAAESM